MVKFIVENGGELSWVDFDGNTLLHEAAKSGDIHLIRYLLSQNVPASSVNKYNLSAASYVKIGAIEVMKELVEAGASLSHSTSSSIF